MPGAGSSPAGAAPAGADLPVTTAPPTPVLPRAERYDPQLGRVRYGTTGELVDEHPVDHFVAMQIGHELGSIPAAPGTGTRMRDALKGVPSQKRQAVAEDEVKRMLAVPIAQGDLELGAVTVDQPRKGRVTFEYKNLRAPERPAPTKKTVA